MTRKTNRSLSESRSVRGAAFDSGTRVCGAHAGDRGLRDPPSPSDVPPRTAGPAAAAGRGWRPGGEERLTQADVTGQHGLQELGEVPPGGQDERVPHGRVIDLGRRKDKARWVAAPGTRDPSKTQPGGELASRRQNELPGRSISSRVFEGGLRGGAESRGKIEVCFRRDARGSSNPAPDSCRTRSKIF